MLNYLSQPKARTSYLRFLLLPAHEALSSMNMAQLCLIPVTAVPVTAVCAQLKRTDCFSISSLFNWSLWKPKNKSSRELAHGKADTQLQNSYSKCIRGGKYWAVLISLLLCSHKYGFYCQIRWMLFTKAWPHASSDACQQVKAESSRAVSSIMTCRSWANSGNLENVLSPKVDAHFHIIYISLFVALITRTTWLIDWKMYYSISCLQKTNTSL